MGTGKMEANPFVIADAGKCIGCKACELACFAVHNRENGVSAAVGTITIPVIPRLYVTKAGRSAAPVQCRHCENAPCAAACPVGAIRQENGAILIDEERCIGCKACALACPFGAIAGQIVFARPGSAAERTFGAYRTRRGAQAAAGRQQMRPVPKLCAAAHMGRSGGPNARRRHGGGSGRIAACRPDAGAGARGRRGVSRLRGRLSGRRAVLGNGKPERTVRPFPDLKAMPF